MPNPYMQLGPIVFQDYEIPSSIRFGGSHRIAVRALSGGGRAVERLGPEDSEIQFEGTFSGPEAEIRSVIFDELRLSAQVVWLAWQSFRRLVVVRTFLADYRNPWWISYKICCVVVQQSISNVVPPAILAATMGSDLSNALAAASASAISLAPLQTGLSGANTTVPGTFDQRAALAAIQATLISLNSEINDQSLVLAGPQAAGLSAGCLSAYVSDLVSSAGILASAAATRAYVARLGVHLHG